jgi:hypothetical protein
MPTNLGRVQPVLPLITNSCFGCAIESPPSPPRYEVPSPHYWKKTGFTVLVYRGFASDFSVSSSRQVQVHPTVETRHDNIFSSVTSGREDPACSVAYIAPRTNPSPRHDDYVFHDTRESEAGSEDEVKTVQDLGRRKTRERWLKDRLYAIRFVPFGIYRFLHLMISWKRFHVTFSHRAPAPELIIRI